MSRKIAGRPAVSARFSGVEPHSTESRLAAIEKHNGAPVAFWVLSLLPAEDRRKQRDAAIVAAAAMLRQASISATARRIETELSRYLAGPAWPRDRNLEAPDPLASPLRALLWRVAALTDGSGLGARRILQILEADPRF